eukprot:scaffold78709_cov31-Tisochrysis_lutea.AAC.1
MAVLLPSSAREETARNLPPFSLSPSVQIGAAGPRRSRAARRKDPSDVTAGRRPLSLRFSPSAPSSQLLHTLGPIR